MMCMSESTKRSPSFMTSPSVLSRARPRLRLAGGRDVLEARTEPQRVLSEELAHGRRCQSRPLGHLLDALRPRGVAVRPVRREQPQVFAELLDTERERPLPAVDR